MSKDEEESPVISDSAEICFTRFQILKNVFVLCVGFFIFLTSHDGLLMLQSTMNHEKGVGVISQTVFLAVFCISSLLSPKYLVSKLGCKLSMVVSMCFFVPFVVANLYPKLVLLIITSIINGIISPVFWSSQCQYLNEMAFLYASISTKEKDKPLGNSCIVQEESNTVKTNKKHDESTYADVKSNVISSKSSDFKNDQILSEGSNENATLSPTTFSSSPKQTQTFAEEGIKTIYSQEKFRKSKEGDICKDGVPQKLCNNIISSKNQANVSNHDINLSSNEQDDVSNHFHMTANEKDDVPTVSPHKVLSISVRFFGVFGMFSLSPRMFSNLMSYFILQKGTSGINFLNSTCTCGAHFCNVKSECFMKNIHVPNNENRNLLIGLCVGFNISAIVLVALFLDPLNDRQRKTKFSLRFFLATFNLLKKKNFILLIPICVYFGMIEGFFAGDFTMSFVGCAWGTFHVGLVSAYYGGASALSSSTAGFMIRYVGRAPVILFALLLNVLVEIALLFWTPSAESPTLFYVVSALWGISVGVLASQLKAMFGFLFKKEKEVSFAVFLVWGSLGYGISMAYSNHMCTYVKIYVLISVLIFATIGYICVEISLRRKPK